MTVKLSSRGCRRTKLCRPRPICRRYDAGSSRANCLGVRLSVPVTRFERDTLAIVLREPSVGGILIGKHFQMVGMIDPVRIGNYRESPTFCRHYRSCMEAAATAGARTRIRAKNMMRRLRPRLLVARRAFLTASGKLLFKSILRCKVALGMKRTRHQLAPAVPMQKVIDRAVAGCVRARSPSCTPP
jgi:hypothetical protein